jgi:hypothetical protein
MSASAATNFAFSDRGPIEPVRQWLVSTREGTIKDTPKWLSSLLDELTAMGRLPANWDSYGARAIDPQAALMTARFLCSALREDAALPKLVPTVRGNIQLEWYNDRAELEIEVGAQGPLTACFADHRSNEEWEREITADLATIVGKINACF